MKEQEAGERTADVCQRHGISQPTFYKWKAKFGGMDVSDARKLRSLEAENTRLKKLLAEQMLDNAQAEERELKKVVTPDAKRGAVSYLQAAYGVSERRASAAMAVDRSTVRHQSKRPDDKELRDQVKQIASERRRFGYRRIHVLLEREGIQVNLKKLRRIYSEEELQMKRRGGRKRALCTPTPNGSPNGDEQRPLELRLCE